MQDLRRRMAQGPGKRPEVEDGHSLHDSLDVLVAEVRDFFELT